MKMRRKAMYMDDIKIFDKNEKELETLIKTLRIYNQDIAMAFGIEKCAMLIMKKGERETGHWPSE